jgi:Protein of unknown function (DUF2905)
MTEFGKGIIIIGILLIIIGVILTLSPKIPFLGKLPGDIYYHKNGFIFYFPLTTSILLSIIISAVLYFLRKQ